MAPLHSGPKVEVTRMDDKGHVYFTVAMFSPEKHAREKKKEQLTLN